MRKISPEMTSSQFLDLDSDWNDVLAPGTGGKSGQSSGKGRLRGHFDGASRGNPGEAGAGAVLFDGRGTPVWECARPLGKKTNNEAEYLALLLLLEELERRGVPADIRGDSRLVVNQVTG
ncbi:MAG TPA: reverse transcriptase-like protein, partial [Aminivibrio sp.]|nr:reverse transcriptase-like protein [Aminivibrio sp.]